VTALIEIERLTKRFGAFTAVDDVSFSVSRGEVLGFLGPNGAGKSTTMRMLAGFMTPTSGTARICGEDVVENPVAAKRHLGFLPEGAPTYPEMSVTGFLRFCGRARGFRGSALADRVAHDKAIVISTHILEEVSAVCTRAVIIARGKVVADATPAELASRGPSMDAVFRDLTLKEAA
jgi:ABC-type multidrug transport system ATPase subunit